MGRALLVMVSVGVLSLSKHAYAEDVFPGALQEAAQMECVPSCLMCHTNNPGTAGTWSSKAFPNELVRTMKITKPGRKDTEGLKAAYAAYVADPKNAAPIAQIKQGIDPHTGDSVCTPSYGCGSSFTDARAPRGGGLFASLLLVSALVARRRYHWAGARRISEAG